MPENSTLGIATSILLAISLAIFLYWIWLNLISIKGETAIARITLSDLLRKAICKERVIIARRIKFFSKEYLIPSAGTITSAGNFPQRVWEFKHKAFQRGKLQIPFEDVTSELTIYGYELVKLAN